MIYIYICMIYIYNTSHSVHWMLLIPVHLFFLGGLIGHEYHHPPKHKHSLNFKSTNQILHDSYIPGLTTHNKNYNKEL